MSVLKRLSALVLSLCLLMAAFPKRWPRNPPATR